MIVMDLEWNRGYDRTSLFEILQIGAVRIERPGGPILSTFCAFIHPRVHKRLDLGAKYLPCLDETYASPLTFPEAWAAFERWCAGDRAFALWGGEDLLVARQNCAFWGVPFTEPERVYDFQLAFSHAYGTADVPMALWRVMDFLGIPCVFDFHNALCDAMYTALAGRWLRQEDLDFQPEPRIKTPRKRHERFSRFPFEPPAPVECGAYATAEEALHGRPCRKAACPLCGRELWVVRWHAADDGAYLAPVLCSAHGRFLCRLTLAEAPSGVLLARQALPELSPELLKQYAGAKERGMIACRRAAPKKRRKKRRAGKRASSSGAAPV